MGVTQRIIAGVTQVSKDATPSVSMTMKNVSMAYEAKGFIMLPRDS